MSVIWSLRREDVPGTGVLIGSFRGTLRVVIPTREGVTMRAVYPAWAYVVPNAPYRRITLLVLVAASIGAVGSAEVVLSLEIDPRTGTETSSVSVGSIVTREPAKVKTVVQDWPKNLPRPKIEQMPQPVPDLRASDRAAAAADAGRLTALPDQRSVQSELPVAPRRPLHERRFGRFATPNHW